MVWPKKPAQAKIAFERTYTQIQDFVGPHSIWSFIVQYFSSSEPRQIIRPMGLSSNLRFLAIADPGSGGIHLVDLENQSSKFIEYGSGQEERSVLDVAVSEKWIFASYPEMKDVVRFDLEGQLSHRFHDPVRLTRPTGLCYEAPYLYVVDTGGNRVYQMSQSLEILQTYDGQPGSLSQLNYPTFIAVSGKDTLYISDTMNFRIVRYLTSGELLDSFGQIGTQGGQFNRLKGISLDGSGNLFCVDNSFDNTQIFNTQGQLLMHFGNTGHLQGEFMMPTDITITGPSIYISDTMNKRIQKFRILYD